MTSTTTLVYRHSSKAAIRQRFAAAWSAICKLHLNFHPTALDALKIELFKSAVKTVATHALESLNLTTRNIFDAGHQQMICTALSINWQNNIMNEEVCAKSGLLPFSQTIRKRRLRLVRHLMRLQSRPITPLWSMLQHLVFSVRRGQGRTWTLAKDLLNDLTATSMTLLTSAPVSLLAWMTHVRIRMQRCVKFQSNR